MRVSGVCKFELPVKEFIRIGDLYRDVDDEEIQEVACAAGADGFIKKLPNGYATNLGTLGEIGIDISGGEWQRLLLACTDQKRRQGYGLG